MKILIIDDSQFTRSKVVNILKNDGHEVVEASNGQEGYERIMADKPELILCDLIMPEMDGYKLLELLKEKGITIPVIVLTADIQKTTKQRVMELGVINVLNKPPKEEDILQAIKNLSE